MNTRVLALLLLVVFATGCGGGGDSSASDAADSTPDPPPSNPPPSNTVPQISGTPLLEITAGEPYSFTPAASDADADALSFSIQNAPTWANFDTNTGVLSGTPEAVDVGTTVGIVISVDDGSDSASLTAFNLTVLARPAGTAIVSWDVPTTNADGSDLNDLAGFAVHYGQASANYSEMVTINDETATSAAIGDLAPGEWFFAVSAFDNADNHSELSAEVSKVVAE